MNIETAKAISNLVPDCRLVAIRELLAERDALKAEIDRLRDWQRQMVEKAASGGRLDGYRELAGKLAAKDAENDRLRAALVAAMEIVQEDRAAFALANIWPDGRMDNDDGDVLRRYDAVIAQAREAMGSEG